jgi:hypothetical protein
VRAWFLLALCLIASLGLADSTLILIPSQDAGPITAEADYGHTTWVLWPKAVGSGENRLLSLLSGMDWKSVVRDQLGYRLAVLQNLGCKPNASDLDPTFGLNLKPNSEPSAISIASVKGPHAWDDLARLTNRRSGRVLVVEVPSTPKSLWTRIWLKGKDWPGQTPEVSSARIVGLVPARDLGSLLTRPETASWYEVDPSRFEPPNRWLEFGHEQGPILLLFASVLAMYGLGLGLYCAAREVRSRICIASLRTIFLGPAIFILAGKLSSMGSVDSWPGSLAVAVIALLACSWLANFAIGKVATAAHPLVGECAVGVVVLSFTDPVWSIFSHILSPHTFPVSLEWFGSLSAYLICLGYLTRLDLLGFIFLVGAALATSQIGFGSDLPLAVATWIPIALIAAPTALKGKFRWATGGILGCLFALAVHRLGFTYAPDGLHETFRSRMAINCADHLAMVASPTFLALVALLGAAFIFRDHFLGHRFRRAIKYSPRPVHLFEPALVLFLCGIFIPIYLHAALAVGFAAIAILLVDAVRAP